MSVQVGYGGVRSESDSVRVPGPAGLRLAAQATTGSTAAPLVRLVGTARPLHWSVEPRCGLRASPGRRPGPRTGPSCSSLEFGSQLSPIVTVKLNLEL